MSDRETIERLIEQTALGNRDAFSALYDATAAKLYSVCLRVLKNRGLAEEALQEAFIKVWHNASQYQVNGLSPMTWMITLTRNCAIDRLRSQRSELEYVADLPDVEDDSINPEQLSTQMSEQAQIERCLEALQEDKAEAVRGAYLEGQSYADLASRFNVPLNTMRTWLRRSLQALKGCMSV